MLWDIWDTIFKFFFVYNRRTKKAIKLFTLQWTKSFFSTQIYFNNFYQCENNCKKLKQILILYRCLLSLEIINQLAKKKLINSTSSLFV